MNFIPLTHISGKPILVNLDCVRTIASNGKGTMLLLTTDVKDVLDVTEHFSDIVSIIETMQRRNK